MAILKKWLRYYLDFCQKYRFAGDKFESLPNFLNKLKEQAQILEQQNQGSYSISLFYKLLYAKQYNWRECMRKSIIFIIIAFTNSFGFAQINIGVVIDGPWEQNNAIREMLKEEISVLTEGEFDVQFPDDKIIIADWTQTGVKAAIDQLLADRSVDLILAMGVLASGELSWRGDLPKPVIAPFVIDAELQGLPSKNGASGVKNLNYLSLPARVPTDIKAFREIVAFDTITILINNEAWQSMPQLGSRTQSSLEEMGIEPVLLPVERTIDTALNALTPDVEAVYVAPLLHLLPGEFDRLVVELKKRRIPSFSLLGRNEVVRGLMATVSPDFFPKLARRVAMNLPFQVSLKLQN